jgi:hypothetical protein
MLYRMLMRRNVSVARSLDQLTSSISSLSSTMEKIGKNFRFPGAAVTANHIDYGTARQWRKHALDKSGVPDPGYFNDGKSQSRSPPAKSEV